MFSRNKDAELPLTHRRHHHKPFENEVERVQTKNMGLARTRMATATEALERWRTGHLPSNNALRTAIDKTQDILQTTARKQHIGGEGQRFIDDLDQLMQDVRDLLTEKNADEHMQRMALHAIGLSNDIAAAHRPASGAPSGVIPGVSGHKISRAISDGVVLVNKLIRDDDFRSCLQEFIDILKSLELAAPPVATTTTTAAAAPAPVEEEPRVRIRTTIVDVAAPAPQSSFTTALPTGGAAGLSGTQASTGLSGTQGSSGQFGTQRSTGLSGTQGTMGTSSTQPSSTFRSAGGVGTSTRLPDATHRTEGGLLTEDRAYRAASLYGGADATEHYRATYYPEDQARGVHYATGIQQTVDRDSTLFRTQPHEEYSFGTVPRGGEGSVVAQSGGQAEFGQQAEFGAAGTQASPAQTQGPYEDEEEVVAKYNFADPSHERSFQALWRLLRRVSGDRALSSAFRRLVKVTKYLEPRKKYMKSTVELTGFEARIEQLRREATILIERFSGGHRLKTFGSDMVAVMNAIKADPEQKDALRQVRKLVYRALNNPNNMYSPRYEYNLSRQFDALLSKTANVRAMPEYAAMLREGGDIIHAITHDPMLKTIREDGRRMLDRVFVRDGAGVKLNAQLFRDLKDPLIHIIRENLRYIGLPPIHQTVETMLGNFDVTATGIVFSALDILPEHVTVKLDNKMALNMHNLDTSVEDAVTRLVFKLRHIDIHLKDIDMTYRRIRAPHTSGNPLVDINTFGRGMAIKLKVEMRQTQPIFTCKDVVCKIDRLVIKSHLPHKDRTFNMITTLFRGRLRRMMEEKVELGLREAITSINVRLNKALTAMPAGRTLPDAVRETVMAERPMRHPSLGQSQGQRMIAGRAM